MTKFAIATLLAALAAPAVNAQSVVGLHGSGTTNPSKCYWHIMDLIQTQTKLPTKMTYRAVGSSTGQLEFIGEVTGNMTTPDNDFGSGDIPLSATDFDLFPADSILHLPIVLGAISFFHSVPTGDVGLNLNPCVLAKIMNRDITDWMDAQVVALNPNLSLPSPYPITVVHRVEGSSSTASITQYLNDACPTQWPETLVGKDIDWKTGTKGCEGSGGMTECITSTPGTIGYIDSGHGHSEGLQEIELLNADKNYISSKEAAVRGGIMSATDDANLPEFLDGSFANVNLLNQVS
jgi:ABC-type phosphate transport system substrate-binding protein